MAYLLFIQLLLLMFIVAASPVPIAYILRHLTRSPAHYITEGMDYEFGWRTTQNLKLNIAILVGIAIAGIVIARALPPDIINPIMILSFFGMTLFVAWSIYSVVTGLQNGRITLMAKGVHFEAERATNAKHFWRVVGWNSFFGLLMLIPLPALYAFYLPTFPFLS